MAQFPKHDIDPDKKDGEWHRQYAEAALDEFNSYNTKMFNKGIEDYREIDLYEIGEPSIDKFKKQLTGSDANDPSWINIDWTFPKVGMKFMDIATSKVYQSMFRPVCTPVDMLAKDEGEKWYADAKVKIMMRDAAMKVAPQLADTPALYKEAGEPEDLEDLEIKVTQGTKLPVAEEAELGISYVFNNNGFDEHRRRAVRSLAAYGVGGYKEWVDENGEVRLRDTDVRKMVVSWCLKPDFSDARFIGELTEVPINELPFDDETKKMIEGKPNSLFNTYNYNSNPRRGFANVLDLEFKTIDDKIYKTFQKGGNVVTRPASYKKWSDNKNAKTIINGKEVLKYSKTPVEVWHKVKWVVGTDFVYDYGSCSYQKRDNKNKSISFSSYHLYAYSFNNMMCSSMMKRIIPVLDEYALTVYKVRHFKAKWLPYIINLDLQAMENVALGAGGEKMTPKDILSLVFQNFVALGRRMDISGQQQNYKMVDIEPTGMEREFSVLAGDLARLLNDMRDALGLNEVTDGSTPGERMLNGVASFANQSTNNALYPMMYADKHTCKSLAKGVIQRLAQTVRDRDVEGVARVLGTDTVKFIRVTKNISDRVFDLQMRDIPTDREKEMMIQYMLGKEGQGLLGPEDITMIMETDNLKQLRSIAAMKIQRRRKEAEAYELAKMEKNGKIQQESAVITAKASQETIQLEKDLELRNAKELKEIEKELLKMKLDAQYHKTDSDMAAKIIQQAGKEEKQEAV